MNEKIPQILFYLFFGMIALVGVFRIVRTKEWLSLTPKNVLANWKPFLLTIVPITALMLVGKFIWPSSEATPNVFTTTLFDAAPYFFATALVTWILSQINLSAELRSFVLLAAAAAVSMPFKAETPAPLLGMIAGLLAWKLTENILHKPESRLDDVTPPLVWLTTVLWSFNLGENGGALCREVVMATFVVAVFIRWVQPILLRNNDNWYLKRVMLTLTGGLALLILTTKVLMHNDLGTTVLLGGAGVLATYLLQSLDKSTDEGPNISRGVKNILLVGIYTLAATRLFGMQGLLVLAAATMVAPTPGSALIAGIFWAARVLIAAFIAQYNSNVTGINLMHSYTSAGLYAGFLLVLVGSLFTRQLTDRRLLLALLLGAMIIIPGAANYFLHAEPTSSFLVALGVTSVLAAYLAPAMYPNQSADQENIILFPAFSAAAAMLCGSLIESGNNAATDQRITALCAVGGVIALIALILFFVGLSSRKHNGAAPVEATGVSG